MRTYRQLKGSVMVGLVMGVVWANLAAAQQKSVAEELLDILKANNQVSEQQYQDLLTRAKAEEETRQAGVEAFRRDPAKEVKKNIDWLDRLSFFGDLRVRHEGFYQSGGPDAEARNRNRIRLRFGAKMKITDEIEGGLRLVSGDPNDPISTNQTIDNLFSRKPLSIDQVYITFTPGASFGIGDWPWKPLSITGGKFANPLFRPKGGMLSEMIFDDDVSPEGLHETFTFFDVKEGFFRRLQLHALQWTVDEASKSGDAFIVGGQAVATLTPSAKTKLTLGFGDYYFSKADRIAQEKNSNGVLNITNSVVLKDGAVVRGGFPLKVNPNNPVRDFLGGFNLLNASAQLDVDTGYPQWPVSLFADVAHNTEAMTGEDFAMWAGAGIGTLKNPGDLAFSVAYGRVETDAVLSVFSYSDLGRSGGTNVQGPMVKIDYLLLPRLTLTAKNHFVSFVDRPAGQSNSMVYRMQLDAVLAF